MEQTLSSRILVVGRYINRTKTLTGHLEGLAAPPDVLYVQDAESALSLLQKQTVHLLIIDTILRGKLDGFDLCRAIRSSSELRQLPVILLLASSLSLERCQGISAGADLLLQRPVVKEELCKMVQLLLELSLYQVASTGANVDRGQFARRLYSVT